MATVGLPLSNGIIGEVLLHTGVYIEVIWYAVFGGLTLILGAAYMLRLYQKTMLGKGEAIADLQIQDLRGSEVAVFVILMIFVLGIGVYPESLLGISEAAVTDLVNQITIK